MKPVVIALATLSAICFLCAWFVPRQLRKSREKKYKLRKFRDSEEPGNYATLGELPADYLDKTADRILREARIKMLELKDSGWQIMLAFLGVILAVIAIIAAFGIS